MIEQVVTQGLVVDDYMTWPAIIMAMALVIAATWVVQRLRLVGSVARR